MSLRCFLALPLRPNVVRRLADHADSLCHLDDTGRMRWVDSDNFHLTLCFLGEIDIEVVNELEQRCGEALSDVQSFQVRLNACEYFSVNKHLAVVAALASPDEPLLQLRKTMIDVVAAVGINRQQQEFKPHVTLGRSADYCPTTTSENWPAMDLISIADSVVLYQSKMGDNGPVYTPLFSIPLLSES